MRRRAVLSSRDISGVISGNLAGPAPQRRVAVRAGRKVGRVDVVEGHVQQPQPIDTAWNLGSLLKLSCLSSSSMGIPRILQTALSRMLN